MTKSLVQFLITNDIKGQVNEGAFAASGTNIAVFGKTHAWIGTGAARKARVLRTTDRGRTWTIADTPLKAGPSAGIFSIAFRDATQGVIVGGDYTKENEAIDNMAVTGDGGATWTLVKGLSGYRSGVAYVPRSTTPALLAVGPSGVDYSFDDGRTWMKSEIRSPELSMPDPNSEIPSGFVTLSFARGGFSGGAVGWGTGARGNMGRVVFRPR